MTAETELYAPVKAFLEAQGYVVKGEVRGCDVVGVRDAGEPVVVELKRGFSLELVLQGVDRLALSPLVYLAVGAWPRRLSEVRRLCRRLGLGLLRVSAHGITPRSNGDGLAWGSGDPARSGCEVDGSPGGWNRPGNGPATRSSRVRPWSSSTSHSSSRRLSGSSGWDGRLSRFTG